MRESAINSRFTVCQRQTSGCVLPLHAVVVEAKMGKCKFNRKWMEEGEFKGWLAPAENSSEAVCKLCKKTFCLCCFKCRSVIILSLFLGLPHTIILIVD